MMRCSKIRPAPSARTGWVIGGVLSVALLSLSGCQQAQLEATQTSYDALNAQVRNLQTELNASRTAIAALQEAQQANHDDVDARLTGLSDHIESLPAELEGLCPEPVAPAPDAQCEESERIQRVVVSGDKMLVGELEHVWIDPPGVSMAARIDSGATSSSFHADNVVTFERDGDDWVRFDMLVNETDTVTVERPVMRYARVIQQADPEGSRRPVVEMRVRLGDVQDIFEFTLADRSHLENEMILGRNFLTDVTLVDVGKQFIQPRYSPPQQEAQ